MADDDKFAQRVLREVALLLSDRECAADTLTFYIEGWNRDPGWDWWGYLKSKYKLPYRDNPFRRRPRGPFLRGPSGWPGYSEPDKSPYPWTKKKTEVESHEQRRQRLLARLKGIDEEEKRVRDQLQMLVELFALAEITDAISPGGQARRARDILRRLIDRARSEAEEGVAGDPKLRAVLDAVDAADRDLQRLDEERASIRRELGNAAK